MAKELQQEVEELLVEFESLNTTSMHDAENVTYTVKS
jgi:hypothetical protein